MSPLYKFACFDCLVSFSRPALRSDDDYSAWLSESEFDHQCPKCGKTLAFMEKNFRSPKKKSVKKWQASKLLWEAGFRYVGSGNHQSEPLPESPKLVRDFIVSHSTHAQKVCLARKWDS